MTTITQRARTETVLRLRNQIIKFIDSAEKYKNSYFWTAPASANSRRAMEFENSFSFEIEGFVYEVEESLRATCKNIYYTKSIYVDEEKKDMRAVKKALAYLDTILERRSLEVA